MKNKYLQFKISIVLSAIALIPVFSSACFADAKPTSITCDSVTPVSSLSNILFKNSNLHGGRGRTFLDQDRQFKGKRTLWVARLDGKVISCFGLYRCDYPYGCRYYQAMCGDRTSNSSLTRSARKGGSSIALVGTGKGQCFSIDTSLARDGSVRK